MDKGGTSIISFRSAGGCVFVAFRSAKGWPRIVSFRSAKGPGPLVITDPTRLDVYRRRAVNQPHIIPALDELSADRAIHERERVQLLEITFPGYAN
jgi:hypothetical protein